MLGGTYLSNAYSIYDSPENINDLSFQSGLDYSPFVMGDIDKNDPKDVMKNSQIMKQSSENEKQVFTPNENKLNNEQNNTQNVKPVQVQKQVQLTPNSSQQQANYSNDMFNKSFEQQQALSQAQAYIKQLQHQLAQQQIVQQQIVQEQSNQQNMKYISNKTDTQKQEEKEDTYFEKIFSKKKEFLKILQWVSIILLSMSLYYFIDHYLQYYLSLHDLTFNKELLLRACVPLLILFIVWNLRVFSKP